MTLNTALGLVIRVSMFGYMRLVTGTVESAQSSTRVWPVILTSGRFKVGTGQDAELQKTRGQALLAPYLLKTNTMKTL